MLQACDQFYLRLLPAVHWVGEGVLKCPNSSKLAEEIWAIWDTAHLCMWSRGFVLGGGRGLGRGFQQSAIEAPFAQAFCFAYPAFPIKRKSRKLNPKLPAPPPQSHAHHADCLQKLNQILGRKSQKSQEKGGRKPKMHGICLRSYSAKFSTALKLVLCYIAHIASVSRVLRLSKFWLNWGILESRLIFPSGEYLAFCPENMGRERCNSGANATAIIKSRGECTCPVLL